MDTERVEGLCLHEPTVKLCNNQRVVTMTDIDIAHNRPKGTARRNFNKNKKHFILGEDYFERNSSEAAMEYGIIAPNGLTLLTETGYLMVVKSFKDDLSWDVQRQLVTGYFRAKEMEEHIKQQSPVPELEQETTATRKAKRNAPRRSTWYVENSSRLNRICKKRHMQLRELYSEILTRLSKVYDIQACRVIYEQENGYPPSYAIDIIPFFKELETEVDKYLQDMDLRLSKDPIGENPFK